MALGVFLLYLMYMLYAPSFYFINTFLNIHSHRLGSVNRLLFQSSRAIPELIECINSVCIVFYFILLSNNYLTCNFASCLYIRIEEHKVLIARKLLFAVQECEFAQLIFASVFFCGVLPTIVRFVFKKTNLCLCNVTAQHLSVLSHGHHDADIAVTTCRGCRTSIQDARCFLYSTELPGIPNQRYSSVPLTMPR